MTFNIPQAYNFLFFVPWKHYDRENVLAKEPQQEIEEKLKKLLLHQYMDFKTKTKTQVSGDKKNQKIHKHTEIAFPLLASALWISWDSLCILDIMVMYYFL